MRTMLRWTAPLMLCLLVGGAFRVKPGEYEAFKAVVGEFKELWVETAYPYDVYSYWPRMAAPVVRP